LTDQGYKEIGSLDGKIVNVWSPFDDDYIKATVFKTGNRKTITLELEDNTTITLTPNHLVLDFETQEWMEARNMLNRKITTEDLSNGKEVVAIIENKVIPVYDFQMEKTHAGVVNGLICHNCGERPGISSSKYGIYDTCDLGHLDINKFIFDKEDKNNVFDVYLDTDSLLSAARLSYYFLDFMHDLMMYPIDEVKKGVIGFRSVGLGFYGLAGALIRLGIPYNSKKGRAFGYNIMKVLETGSLFESYEATKYLPPMLFNKIGDPSIMPAEIWYGPNEEYEKLNEWGTGRLNAIFNKVLDYLQADISDNIIKRRNINTTTVAPTGTTSQLGFTKRWGDVGSGIEPIFSFHYERTITSKNKEKSKVEYTATIADRILPDEIKEYFKEHNGDLSELDSKYDIYKDIFVSANDIDYNDHI